MSSIAVIPRFDVEPIAKIRKLSNATANGAKNTTGVVVPSDVPFKLSTSAMDKLAVVAAHQIFSQKSHPAVTTGVPQIASSVPRIMKSMSNSPDELTQQKSHPAANTGVPPIEAGAPRLIKLASNLPDKPTQQNNYPSANEPTPAMEPYALRAIKLMSKSCNNTLPAASSGVPKIQPLMKLMSDSFVKPTQQNSHPAANTGAHKILPGDFKTVRQTLKNNPQTPPLQLA